LILAHIPIWRSLRDCGMVENVLRRTLHDRVGNLGRA
jgi:hypothetical protein